MLARISSGAAGVRDYLETARKKGREFERDLIDDRFVLSGDIDTMDAVIASIQTTQPGAARYLHITLGFSERFTVAEQHGPGEINLRTMAAATEAYRELLMAAYARDEYAWYAEAHIPKVSHDIHSTSGEAIERLPHVHIVLPMRNLVDGRYLNPTGYGQFNIQFQQAIQETVNRRFSLRSPLDALRDQAPMQALARHKPMPDVTSAKQLKEVLHERIAAGEIVSFEQLVQAARAFGAVRVRQGKDGDYVNVKPAWAAKGINLKAFTRDVFSEDRAAARAQEISARAKRPDFEAVLQDWKDRASLEARFLTSANRKRYHALEPEAKAAWLAGSAIQARALVRAEVGDSPEHPIQYKETASHEPADQLQLVTVAALQSDLADGRREEPPESIAGVRHLSQLDMAQYPGPDQLLLQPHASDGLGPQDRADRAMRRAGDRDSATATGDAGRLKVDVAAGLNCDIGSGAPTPDQLKGDTSPSLVLEAAARQFGLDKSQYDITSGRDGAPRIRHEDKHYNLGDFFTKHLKVPWAQAQQILERCYYATLADSLPAPDRKLWRSFTEWRSRKFETAVRMKAQGSVDVSREILEARTKFKAIKASVHRLAAAKRQVLLAQARAEQLVAIEAAKAKARKRREEHALPSRNAMYRAFLTELANGGQLNALAELRRLAKPDPDVSQTITGRKSRPVFPQPRYRVDHAGKVIYYQADKAVVTDSVKGVSVIEAADGSYALALKVAVARYGTHLTFNGDAIFMQRMVAAARNSGMRLSIRDAAKPTAPLLQIQTDIQR